MDNLEKEWFVKMPWGRMCVVAWGNCLDPPVLLCHGSLDSAATFKPIMKYLVPNFYYVAMELPGNGKSDPYPKGMNIHCYDLVYAMKLLVQHFGWSNFRFIGHSMGTLIGKLYDLAYPGQMTQVVDLDPTPVYVVVETNDFRDWYDRNYRSYFDNYQKYNASSDTAPSYATKDAIKMLIENRNIKENDAETVLKRISEEIKPGVIRFIYDQRIKSITAPIFSLKHKEKILTQIKTPILSILASNTVKAGLYDVCSFSMDESCHVHKNYRFRVVDGFHDIHICSAKAVAGLINVFFTGGLKGLDFKGKL